METLTHQKLKRTGARFLVRWGFQAVATEVSSPIPRHRVDVAGYIDATPLAPGERREIERRTALGPSLFDGLSGATTGRRTPCEPRTVVIECKQSRADFLRDRRDMARLLQLRKRLEARKEFLERAVLMPREPQLRVAGSSLFPDMEAWDFAQSRQPAYLSTIERIARVEKAIYGETKFCLMAAWRLVDWMYILAPRGVVHRGEIPPGWGLLECSARSLGRSAEEELELTVASPAPTHTARPERRARLLRNIAAAATRESLRLTLREENV